MAGAVSEPIKRCCELLRTSRTDAEKFAALFMVTKLVKAKDCTTAGKTALFEAIGFPYLKKLLNSESVPDDCPPSIYKSVALSILTCFCADEALATHADMLANIPVFVDIVRTADDEDYDDNLIIVSEAYSCLQSIAAFEPGLQALLAGGIIGQMSAIYSQQSFQTDEALNLLCTLAGRFGTAAWPKDDARPFNTLVQRIALDMETDHTERKFELCTILTQLIDSCRHDVVVPTLAEEIWPESCYKGLSDILKSKIGKAQREPALRLAGVMMQLLGVEWALSDAEEPKTFFLLLLQLAAIEVRMQLDDRSFKQALVQQSLVTACFCILEVSINYMHTDQLDLEQKEKQTVYTGLKGAFGGIASVLTKLDKDKKSAAELPEKERLYALAMVRCMCAWLAQETTALRPAIYALLPYVFQLVNASFESARAHRKEAAAAVGDRPTDVLRIMLPALCHLTVEDKARDVMFKQGQEAVLMESLEYYFSIAHWKRPPVPRAERLARMNDPDPVLTPEQLDEQKDARAAIVSLCNIFMNLTVLEVRRIETNEVFDRLLTFCCESLPALREVPENLVVQGHLAVLGLLLLKQQAKKIKKNDFTICRYVQATIRFLWDAYIVDESNDPTALVVAMSYKENWSELAELWFLGMQTMSAILAPIPWLSEFALESGWAEGIVETLKKVKIGTLPANVKSAFEDFLGSLVAANPAVAGVLKKADALRVCRNHRLMELGKALFGE